MSNKNTRAKEYLRNRVANGICATCGKPNDLVGKWNCTKCAKEKAEVAKAYYTPISQDELARKKELRRRTHLGIVYDTAEEAEKVRYERHVTQMREYRRKLAGIPLDAPVNPRIRRGDGVEMVDVETGEVIDTYKSLAAAARDLDLSVHIMKKYADKNIVIDGIYYRRREVKR